MSAFPKSMKPVLCNPDKPQMLPVLGLPTRFVKFCSTAEHLRNPVLLVRQTVV